MFSTRRFRETTATPTQAAPGFTCNERPAGVFQLPNLLCGKSLDIGTEIAISKQPTTECYNPLYEQAEGGSRPASPDVLLCSSRVSSSSIGSWSSGSGGDVAGVADQQQQQQQQSIGMQKPYAAAAASRTSGASSLARASEF
jgi:hypothetical protein